MAFATGGGGATRYTLFDQEPDEDQALSKLVPTCAFEWNGEFARRTKIVAEVLLVAFGDQAVPFAQERVVAAQGTAYVKVAKIEVSVPEELAVPYQKTSGAAPCEVYCLLGDGKGDDSDAVACEVCVVVVGTQLGPHEAVVWGDLVTTMVEAQRVVVLESGRQLELFSDDTANASSEVRCLMTAKARKALGERSPLCPFLGAPNIISGAAAHLMAIYQYTNVAATIFVAYRDVHDIDIASLRAFEVALTADERLVQIHGRDADCTVAFAAAVARAQRFSTPSTLYA